MGWNHHLENVGEFWWHDPFKTDVFSHTIWSKKNNVLREMGRAKKYIPLVPFHMESEKGIFRRVFFFWKAWFSCSLLNFSDISWCMIFCLKIRIAMTFDQNWVSSCRRFPATELPMTILTLLDLCLVSQRPLKCYSPWFLLIPYHCKKNSLSKRPWNTWSLDLPGWHARWDKINTKVMSPQGEGWTWD